MKKYLLIDTWNGEGYSESSAKVKTYSCLAEAMLDAQTEAQMQAGTAGKIDLDLDGASISFVYEVDGREGDSGAVHLIEFPEHFIGLIIKPMINDFKVVKQWDEWHKLIKHVKENSEEYKDGLELYGNCHHNIMEDTDYILYNNESLISKQLKITEGGDGVEYEYWEDENTGEIYKVPIEIVRSFNEMELIENN